MSGKIKRLESDSNFYWFLSKMRKKYFGVASPDSNGCCRLPAFVVTPK